MVNLINLPAFKPSPLMDLAPIASALAMRQKAMEAERDRALRQQQIDNQQGQFDKSHGLAVNADARAEKRSPYELAQIQAATGASNASANASRVAATNAQMQEERDADFYQHKVAKAEQDLETGNYIPVKEDQRLLNKKTGTFVEQPGGGLTEGRTRRLEALGIDPNSAEGQNFILNGKLSETAMKIIQKNKLKETQGTKVSESLENLKTFPDKYGQTFESATGPLASGEPGSMLSAPFAYAARGVGEVTNYGQKHSPSEVRSNIQGGVLALSQAIKPLIRDPGEGVFTDQDQEVLNKIVGNIGEARNAEEYYRRLNDVRDRLKASLGMDIKFDATPPKKGQGATPQAAAPAGSQPPPPKPMQAAPAPKRGMIEDGWRFLGGDPKDKNNWRPAQ